MQKAGPAIAQHISFSLLPRNSYTRKSGWSFTSLFQLTSLTLHDHWRPVKCLFSPLHLFQIISNKKLWATNLTWSKQLRTDVMPCCSALNWKHLLRALYSAANITLSGMLLSLQLMSLKPPANNLSWTLRHLHDCPINHRAAAESTVLSWATPPPTHPVSAQSAGCSNSRILLGLNCILKWVTSLPVFDHMINGRNPYSHATVFAEHDEKMLTQTTKNDFLYWLM